MAPAWILSHQFQKKTLLRICWGRLLTPFHLALVIGRGSTIWVTMLPLAIHIPSLRREARSTLNYNLSLQPLIITPLLQQRQYKLCIHWWEISVAEARTRSVRWKIWVTMLVYWWDITTRYIVQDFVKLFLLWIIFFSHKFPFLETHFQ